MSKTSAEKFRERQKLNSKQNDASPNHQEAEHDDVSIDFGNISSEDARHIPSDNPYIQQSHIAPENISIKVLAKAMKKKQHGDMLSPEEEDIINAMTDPQFMEHFKSRIKKIFMVIQLTIICIIIAIVLL